MTWAERIAHISGQLDHEHEHAPLVTLLERKLADYAADRASTAEQLHSWIAQYLFVHGAAKTAELFAAVQHVLPKAVAAYLRERPASAPLSNGLVEIASAVNAFEILGYAVPASVLESIRAYLPRVEQDRSFAFFEWNRGLAGIALAEPLVWVPVAGHTEEADVRWQPGATFGANVQGLIAHLGAARSRGATQADVEPAWHSFMGAADFLVDEQQIDYATILWVARIVLHDLGGLPLGEVAAGLQAEIERCVAAGT